ncbi:MAG: alpha/beta fold hydrolase [Candidatus Ancaeobacter aquaticus]|nr:alpha/beta fold hydrolase [Candidatus Ancaeobacter aquaticus]
MMKLFSILIISFGLVFNPLSAHAFIFDFLGGDQNDTKSEPHYVATPDGWKIAIEHVSSRGIANDNPPVILCHGLGYNGDFWMLSREMNLAQYLADRGYDVWIMSLRGAGKSTKWVYKIAEMGMETPAILDNIDNEDYTSLAIRGVGMLFKLSQAKMTNASINPKFINWTFDDYVNYDVPTAIEFVKQKTGSPDIFWVGHSMGGNILLAHLAKYQRRDIRGVVTIGSQLTMADGHVVNEYINTLQWLRLLELQGGVEAEKAKRMAQEQGRALLFNQGNMERDVIGRLEISGTDTPAVGVLGQYLELVGSGEFKTADNSYNYARSAQNIKVPLLACAGQRDAFVNPKDLLFLRDNVGSTDCQAVLLGPSVGMYPYGHNDSLISRRAAREVYPMIGKWLDDHREYYSPPVKNTQMQPQSATRKVYMQHGYGVTSTKYSTFTSPKSTVSTPQYVPPPQTHQQGQGSQNQNNDDLPKAKRVYPF